MYEFHVLACLIRRPMHGYLIAKIVGDIIGPFRHVQWGALYPVLARLERDGLITVIEESSADGRCKKVCAITDAGRDRLHELLMDTSHHLGEYDSIFAHKVALFPWLRDEERVYLCRHYVVHAQQSIDHYLREERDLRDNAHLPPDQLEAILAVMDHHIAYWERERAWAENLLIANQQKEAV